jgi:signal transduction histidine kinase
MTDGTNRKEELTRLDSALRAILESRKDEVFLVGRLILHEYGNAITALKGFFDLHETELPVEAAQAMERNMAILDSNNERYKEIDKILSEGSPEIDAFEKIDIIEGFVRDAIKAIDEIERLYNESGVKIEELFTAIQIFKDFIRQVGSDELIITEFEFNKIVEMTVLHVPSVKAGLLTKRQDIEIIEYYDQEINEIWADRFKLRSVLVNLFKNAEEAMPDGGRLTIRTRLQGNKVLVQVSDTGIGIPKNKLNRVFEPYYSTKGTMGVGLAYCKKIIEKHGGSISVKSEINKGTTFTITLPISQPPPTETGIIFVPTHENVLNFINGDEHILICDADDDRTAKAWEASKMGIPYKSDETNWVIEAERRGCDWSLLHPKWQVEEMPFHFIPGPIPIMTVDNFTPKESSRKRPVILTICFDYFASLDRTVIHFDGQVSRMGKHYPSEDEIFEQARILAKCLEDNGIIPDKIICAESKNYCPEEYIPIIKRAIIKAFQGPVDIPKINLPNNKNILTNS